MTDKFVIGIDSSTQMAKAVAWSRDGKALGEGRAPIPMLRPQEAWCEQEVESWWTACKEALQELGQAVDLSRAAGLAVSNQRETVGFLDADGNSVRPGMVWLDERAAPQVQRLAKAVGSERLHQITGKPIDLTPVAYRLKWMQENEPDNLSRTAQAVDVQGYLVGQLTGKIAASWTSADPFGTFDLARKTWSPEVLAAIGMTADQFPPVVRPGTVIGNVTRNAAQATGLPEGLRVIAAGGDGQCAGLGVNAVGRGIGYLNLGTALIIGAWAEEPRVSLSWRTMSSPTGEGYFLEGVLRAGTFLVDWVVRNFIGGDTSAEAFARLEAAARDIPVGAEGLLVSPYLSGCMNPHWSGEARAAFFGMKPEHGPGHLYRAVLESLTGEVARALQDMRAEGVVVKTIIAVGGGANSTMWLKMISDATGLPVKVSSSLEASSLGAGMTAAVGLGWYDDFETAAAGMSSAEDAQSPSDRDRAAWQDLLERQDRLNRIVVAEAALAKPGKQVGGA
ncbi:MAG: xylulokinase [Pseudorhodobacter sp.]